MVEYWELTPNEFRKYVEVFEQKADNDYKMKDALNWILGKYIMAAFNAPDRYPDKPFSDDSKPKDDVMSDDTMEAMAKAFNKIFGGIEQQ